MTVGAHGPLARDPIFLDHVVATCPRRGCIALLGWGHQRGEAADAKPTPMISRFLVILLPLAVALMIGSPRINLKEIDARLFFVAAVGGTFASDHSHNVEACQSSWSPDRRKVVGEPTGSRRHAMAWRTGLCSSLAVFSCLCSILFRFRSQDLVLAVIGEMFEEPNVVGIGMAIRSREDLLSVWNEDNRNDQVQCNSPTFRMVPVQVLSMSPPTHRRDCPNVQPHLNWLLVFLADYSPLLQLTWVQVRFNIGERLKQVLDLEPSTLIEYKHHQIAMQDMSTFRYKSPNSRASKSRACCTHLWASGIAVSARYRTSHRCCCPRRVRRGRSGPHVYTQASAWFGPQKKSTTRAG